MHASLTDRYIQSIKTTDFTTHWDLYLPAFGVRCGKRAKTFVVMIGKKRRRITIGRYGAITLKDARDKARLILSKADSFSPLFSEVLEDYIRLHLTPNTKPRTAKEFERLLRRHFAALANRHITDVTARNVMSIISTLAGRPTEANQAYTAIKALFNWTLSQQLITASPLAGIRIPFKKTSRDRLLSDEEVSLIWHESHNHNGFGQLIRISILSGQRIGQWDNEYRIHDGVISFPATSMKSNAQHSIVATPALLRELNAFVPCSNHSHQMRALRAALPPMPRWTLHDFRRYFSSTMAKLRVPVDITEVVLAHASGTRSNIQRTYDRYDRIAPMREALERFEHHLFTSVLAEQTREVPLGDIAKRHAAPVLSHRAGHPPGLSRDLLKQEDERHADHLQGIATPLQYRF